MRERSRLRDRNDAYALFRDLKAPERLLRHVRLVGEAVDLLIDAFEALGIGGSAKQAIIAS